MTAPPFSDAYTAALLAVRDRGFLLSRVAQAQLIAAFEDAAQRIELDLALSDQVLTQERAAALKGQLDGILQELERRVGQITNRTVQLTVEDVVQIHDRVITDLFIRQVGQVPSTVVSNLARVPARAVAVLAARQGIGGGAAGFQTLMKYHVEQAAPDLDRMILSAIARGVSTRTLTRDIADFLANGVGDIKPYGLRPTDVTGLATLQSDARRIAVNETLNALREASAQSSMASSVIEAHRWQRSGRHAGLPSAPDECDLMAEADLYGIGAGWFPVDRLPIAPHILCGCTHGEVRLRHPSQWGSPRPAGPSLAIDWDTFDPSEHVAATKNWSELRTARAVTALRRAVSDPVGRRARKAA